MKKHYNLPEIIYNSKPKIYIMEENLMNNKNKLSNYYNILFIMLAITIVTLVLLIKPQVGVADQGDFNRIMSVSGLSLLDSDSNNPNFIRFYKYIVTDYKITTIDNIAKTISSSSLVYIIVLVNTISKSIGNLTFKTQYLMVIYSIVYIFSFSLILKSFNIKNRIKYGTVILIILFVFFDGNYLIWFNSLYGEPMMFVSLTLFIASVFNYIYYKYMLKKNEKITLKIIFILFSAFLFLGSKLQVITSLPIIIIFISKIIYDNRHFLSKINLYILCFILCVITVYPIVISCYSRDLNNDTQYNSVFYGILKDSKTPKEDLIDLGLNPDMSIEAGKTAYLDENKYIKYSPKSELTAKEFYTNISNFKIAKFYITHPLRLLDGMEYTAQEAFCTSTDLGKCYRSYSQTPVTDFNRFTLWSLFRQNILPRELYFIISVYILILIYSLYKYIKSKSNLEIKTKTYLLWIIMVISIIQFPMPFIGNGAADTAKQLFLFNFIFDGLISMIFAYIIFKVIDLINIK